MTERQPPGDRRSNPYQPPRFHSEHEHYSPSSGYTPPFKPPAPAPSLPKGIYARGKRAWRTYRGLDQRARADSMVWWGVKFIQGLVFGGGLFVIGVIVVSLSVFLGRLTCLSATGIGMVLAGLVIFLYYAAAPVTCHWTVIVPEKHYWVVEDQYGLTLNYLPSGKRTIPWQRSIKVQDYADFKWFTANQWIENALQIEGKPVAFEIVVVINFNPADAHPDQYGALREFTSRELFEATFAREAQRIVRYQLSHVSADDQRYYVYNPHELEAIIAQELSSYDDMGLTLASSHPVSVFVHGAPPLAEAPLRADPAKPFEAPTQPKMDTPVSPPDVPKGSDVPTQERTPPLSPVQEPAPRPKEPTRPSDLTEPMDPMLRRSLDRDSDKG